MGPPHLAGVNTHHGAVPARFDLLAPASFTPQVWPLLYRYRGQGLGRALAGEMFAVARALGLRKILAQMTPDQKAAVATFEHLGFQREARLHDLIMDRRGRTRDLLIMTYDAVAPAPPHDWTARLRRAGVPWRSAHDR